MERSGWIANRNYDLCFFFLPSLLAIVAGTIAILHPEYVALIWWLAIGLIEGPHLVATFTRTYLDSNERKEKRMLLLSSLLLFIPGNILWGISCYVSSDNIFELFLGFAALWSLYHGIRQHYGVMCIYHRTTHTPKNYRRIDSIYIYGMMYSFVLLPLLMHKANHDLFGVSQPIPFWIQYIIVTIITANLWFTLWYVSKIYQRFRENVSIKPALFVLFPVVGLGASMVFFFGFYEPIFDHPVHSEQIFLVVTFMSIISHGLEYLGVVFVVNKKRYNNKNNFLGYIGSKPFVGYAVLIFVSVFYILLNIAKGSSPSVTFFGVNSNTAKLFLAVYWGLFFHHYYLDQKIWKMSKDKKLRQELQLEGV